MIYTPVHPDFRHQIEARNRSRGHIGYAFHMEMGSGKSKVAIDEFSELYIEKEIDTVLVTAGKGSYSDWTLGHLPTHMVPSIPHTVYMWRSSESSTEQTLRKQILTQTPGVLRILVMNYEALGASEKAQKFVTAFVETGRCYWASDESTGFKNHESSRTKFMVRLRRKITYRRNLTGSPITKSPLDLWGQFECLGDGLLGQRSFYGFRSRYCIMKSISVGARTIQVPVAFHNLGELESIVAEHAFRITKEECLDLPPKTYRMIHVPLSKQQREYYNEIKQFASTTLNGGERITAHTAMGILAKMHQIACGCVPDENGNAIELESDRPGALLHYIEECSGQVVIWCAYRANVRLVLRELRRVYGNDSAVQFDGSVDQTQRDINKQRYMSGDARFFVATPHTGGRGLQLVRGHECAYYSNTYDLEHRLQSEDRLHRIGQTGASVDYADFVAPDTVEEKIVRSLRNKIDIAAQINGDNAKEWLL